MRHGRTTMMDERGQRGKLVESQKLQWSSRPANLPWLVSGLVIAPATFFASSTKTLQMKAGT